MAGDWIKMRDNLWDDPRVAKIVDLTDSSEAAVVGALYWLWATADQHTYDGIMPGLTLRSINRKTGVAGFSEALCEIGWLEDHPQGARIIDFDKHNGSSAKKRLDTAKRVANHRSGNADVTLQALQKQLHDVTDALAREREELEKEKRKKKEGGNAGEVGETPPVEIPTPPHFSIEYQKVIEANRPDLTATARQVWALFCETYPPEKRGIARWTKWVSEEKKPPTALQSITTPSKPGIDTALAKRINEQVSGICKPPDSVRLAELARLARPQGVRA